jgi:hypothetical protein
LAECIVIGRDAKTADRGLYFVSLIIFLPYNVSGDIKLRMQIWYVRKGVSMDNGESRDLIRCEDGNKVYWIPRTTFARMVMEVKLPGTKFVRYRTGAEMYDMSERQFKELAKDAGAVYKINRMVLVNVELFDRYLECFRL